MNIVSNLTSNRNGGNLTNILNTAIGTTSNKHLVNGSSFNLLPPLQTNIIQRTSHSRLTCIIMSLLINTGNTPIHGHGILWTSSPRDRRCNILRLDDHSLIKRGTLISLQSLPILHSPIPLLSRRTHGPSLQILKCNLIGGNNPRTSTSLNGHVGNTHSSLHTQRFNRLTCKLNRGSSPPRGTNHIANVQNDIFGGNSLPQWSINSNQHIHRLGLWQSLRRQHMFHLTRPNPKCQRSKRPMSRCMRIPTDSRTSRQCKSLLGSNNMDNALSFILHSKVLETKVLHVGLHLQYLGATCGLFDELRHVNQS
mmetsp:Transcript_10428/g.17278  ORF Transcript_10428/g.17278 Transcript_10428/m.17278 type:complete len:309 (-) Transcript_10428:467-1393(-)